MRDGAGHRRISPARAGLQCNLLHLGAVELGRHFYQFSLRFFLDIFEYVPLHNPNLNNVSDHGQRRNILLNDLFLVAYKRTSRTLFHRDHVMLAALLAQVKLRGEEEITDEYEFLLGVRTRDPSETLAHSASNRVGARFPLQRAAQAVPRIGVLSIGRHASGSN